MTKEEKHDLFVTAYNEIDRCIGDMVICHRMGWSEPVKYERDKLMLEIARRFNDRVVTFIDMKALRREAEEAQNETN